MSGEQPGTPEEVDMRAGEYVLGVLESAEMRAMERQAQLDPQLAHAIAGWERRLAPMLTVVADMKPPATLWANIQHAKAQLPLERHSRQLPPPASGWRRPAAAPRIWPWKVSTAGSLALAASLAAFIALPTPAPRPTDIAMAGRDMPLVAVLTQPDTPEDTHQETVAQTASDTGSGKLLELRAGGLEPTPAAARAAGFLVTAWPDGTVALTAFAPVPVPDGKTLELWIKPPGDKAARSLGVLGAAGRQVKLPAMPVDATALSVTLEPPGGSRSGVPTGRVVYAGSLRLLPR